MPDPLTIPEALRPGALTMLHAIESLPTQLRTGLQQAAEIGAFARGQAQHVVVCGMGGSAFPSDLLQLLIAQLGAPSAPPLSLQVLRDYQPSPLHAHHIDAQCLFIAASFSGNTEETLAGAQRALDAGAQLLILSTGGKLVRFAEQHGLPVVLLTPPLPNFQPRAATGLFLGALAGILQAAGLLPGAAQALLSLADSLPGLLLREGLRTEPLTEHDIEARIAPVRTLSQQFKDRIPVFYAAGLEAEAVARIAKIKINENAKMPAFWAALPEFNHNELVGYTRLTGPFCAVFVEDPSASLALRRRMEVSQRVLREHGVPTIAWPLPAGTTRLGAALLWLYRVDLLSVALALDAGIDPNPVELVEHFKALLEA